MQLKITDSSIQTPCGEKRVNSVYNPANWLLWFKIHRLLCPVCARVGIA